MHIKTLIFHVIELFICSPRMASSQPAHLSDSARSLAQDATSLPVLRTPHDALREGLVTLKDGAKSGHPVEQVQLAVQSTVEESRMDMLRNVYGSGLPARMQIERQILARCVGVKELYGMERVAFALSRVYQQRGRAFQVPNQFQGLDALTHAL